jgi:hypothetical protein
MEPVCDVQINKPLQLHPGKIIFTIQILIGIRSPHNMRNGSVETRLAHVINWRVTMKKSYSFIYLFILLSVCSFSPMSLCADEGSGLSMGQTIYVPAYSHIYSGNIENPFLLAVTLSIRNIDPHNKIRITIVDYYGTEGKLIKKYIDHPVTLKPLESLRYVIPEKDKSGGSGANFIVEWKSDNLVNPPIVESIMIGTQIQQGISFTSRGRVIIVPE